jgi:hydroxyacylglutathione hydrolase
MELRQFVLEGLGNSSYLVAAAEGGVAVVIDPDRDVAPYLEAAAELGVSIGLVLETHLHNDFVSGARELAARTGATVGASAAGELRYPHRALCDGDRLPVGSLEVEVVATPGHTPEHIAFVLHEGGQPVGLFSGGSMLVGSVARSDLLGPDLATGLAEQMFHSLHDRLLTLPDHLAVYPTHGAGSFCSAGSCDARTTTIGQERRNSRLLQLDSVDVFIHEALRDLPPYPSYFRRMRSINQGGPRLLNGLPELPPLSPEQAAPTDGQLLIDSRVSIAYSHSHVPDSVGIGLSPSFGIWVGWLLPHDLPLSFIVDGPWNDDEISRQLVRIGYENLKGSLIGGVDAWRRSGQPTRETPVVSVADLQQLRCQDSELVVLDVRHESEWRAGHIPGALHLPLPELEARVGSVLERDRPVAIHCAAAYRSGMAVSLLERHGYSRLMHVNGGFDAWRAAGFEVGRSPV